MTTANANYDVIVIGGGASGMMAALTAASNGASVLLLDKNERLGEKLRITGGGRCNITNAEPNIRTLLANYGDAEKFLYSAFSQFDNNHAIEFFSSLGLPTKTEDRQRVFPISESAPDVANKLVNALRDANVAVSLNTTVTKLNIEDGNIQSASTANQELKATNFILATGGTSRPDTGATGDGFDWLGDTGHNVQEATPDITPLSVEEPVVEKVAGNTVKNANLTFLVDGKTKFKVNGDVLFTHFGLSGPTILNCASKVKSILEEGVVTVRIDLRPGSTETQLDQEIIKVLAEHPGKQVKNVLGYFTPDGFKPLVSMLLSDTINLDTKTSEFSRANRKMLVDTIKGIKLTINGLMGFERAVVADGGVALTDIDMRTMRSQVINNLFVTGDLLNINRPSGGYSLQLCWTTGYIAGLNASQN